MSLGLDDLFGIFASGAPGTWDEVQVLLTHPAVSERVAASAQNQAKSALLFLYKEVLAIELPWLDDVESAKASKHLPVVLSRQEVAAIVPGLDGSLKAWRPNPTGVSSSSRNA